MTSHCWEGEVESRFARKEVEKIMSPAMRPLTRHFELYSIHINRTEEIKMKNNLMKNNLTELVFILDRSGSMGGLESDTIGGFNSMLAKQQAEPSECRITTILFDNQYETLHDRIDLQAVSPITPQEYFVRGQTALLDAVGITINKIIGVQKNIAKEHRAAKVLFVITTDGMENASREFTYDKVKALIEQQKSDHGWEFIFLGANIDAVEVAGRFGIDRSRAQNFHNDSEGIALNYSVLSDTIKMARAAPASAPAMFSDDWNDEIQTDFQGRGKAGKWRR